MAARAGVELTTLQLRVIDLTNAPPRPTKVRGVSIHPLLSLAETLNVPLLEIFKSQLKAYFVKYRMTAIQFLTC